MAFPCVRERLPPIGAKRAFHVPRKYRPGVPVAHGTAQPQNPLTLSVDVGDAPNGQLAVSPTSSPSKIHTSLVDVVGARYQLVADFDRRKSGGTKESASGVDHSFGDR